MQVISVVETIVRDACRQPIRRVKKPPLCDAPVGEAEKLGRARAWRRGGLLRRLCRRCRLARLIHPSKTGGAESSSVKCMIN